MGDALGQFGGGLPGCPATQPSAGGLFVERGVTHDASIALLQREGATHDGPRETGRHHKPFDLEGSAGRDRLARSNRHTTSGSPRSQDGAGATNTGGSDSSALGTPLGCTAVGPREDDLHLARAQTEIVREAAVAAHSRPRRHAPFEHFLANRACPRPRVGIARQRNAEIVLGVTLKALPLEDLRDLVLEDDVGRDRLVRIGRRREPRIAATRTAAPPAPAVNRIVLILAPVPRISERSSYPRSLIPDPCDNSPAMQQLMREMDLVPFLFITGFLIVIATIAIVAGFHTRSRAALVKSTPTSNMAMAQEGYCEFEGIIEAIPGAEVIAPLTLAPCAWYHARLEKWDSERGRAPAAGRQSGTPPAARRSSFATRPASASCFRFWRK